MADLEKAYEPQKVEKKIYDFWIKNNLFKANVNQNKKPFTIVMPPPNITGRLHLGHAMDTTIQDVLIRYKKMQGFETLWVPGTDHSALATEVKIVKELQKNGTNKESLGRTSFLKYAYDWKNKYQALIKEQIKCLGASCDWTRERFTMDEGCSRAVNEFFFRLYKKNLIYRGKKIINWCPHCLTTIADSEVDYIPEETTLYYLKYKISDSGKYLKVATTRPETIFGDVAVAVNPEDERYKKLIGKTVQIPLVGREVPIISDSHVEINFGTGVLKVTPAHSMDDFEIGLKHNLQSISTIDKHGFLNEKTGTYKGIERFSARKKIVDDLNKNELIAKKEILNHNIGTCYRCATPIEPRISTQWFVKMKDLAKSAKTCVQNGDINFVTKRFEKIFFHWMDNIKDWCISRQIWWGHRIPVWYCKKCKNTMVSKIEITKCSNCGSNEVFQDEDTLDTWFSSGLWPFSTLGWPEKTSDLDYFFPTSVIVSGYDILFFWIAKMIFSSIAMTGQKPFDKIYLHGLIRDSKGRKMSKSLGNGIDPTDMIKKYGADALRISLLTGNSPGNDLCFSEEKVVSNRNFINKIWNAARFILINTNNNESTNLNMLKKTTIFDQWIILKLKNLVNEATGNIEKFEFGLAIEKIRSFVWEDFCDWYLEFAKISINNDINSDSAKSTLIFVFTNILKLLHPFAPFITEQVWQFFPASNENFTIMTSKFPNTEDFKNIKISNDSAKNVKFLIDMIRKIRNKKNEFKTLEGKDSILKIKTKNKFLENPNIKLYISKLTKISDITFCENDELIKNSIKVCLKDTQIFIVNNKKFDTNAEIVRLENEFKKLEEKLKKANSQLSNEKFIKNAPKTVTEKIRQNVQIFKQELDILTTDIEYLKENN